MALASADSSLVTVPQSVSVQVRDTSARFEVKTKPVRTETSVSITAEAGGVTKTATVVLTPRPVVSLPISLKISPESVKAGAQATGTVTLSSAAPAGGLTVTLSSGDTAAARV